MFYNTIHVPKDLLIKALKKVKKQELKVLAVFKVTLMNELTPSEVYKALQEVYPITSIRRAITDLTGKGLLKKTYVQRPGLYGTLNYTWTLKS